MKGKGVGQGGGAETNSLVWWNVGERQGGGARGWGRNKYLGMVEGG